MSSTTFTDFKFHKIIQATLDKQKYRNPTPIQQKAIPLLMEGEDVLGCAQTGTGKTAAFILPFINKLAMFVPTPIPYSPRAIVIVPTRELAEQIADSCHTYSNNLNITTLAIFGGVKAEKQIKAIKDGVHIIVTTPGRFIDLFENNSISLESVQYFVIDEADKMLDMGFLPDIEKIMANLPKKHQTALFSATFPPQVYAVAQSLMKNPKEVKVSDGSLIAEKIDQRVVFLDADKKAEFLKELLVGNSMTKTIIFGRTKLAVDREAKVLYEAGIKVGILHGDKFARDRKKIIEKFQSGEIDVLFATDLASRGLDIENISHVINFNIPEDPEDYIHRVGRTARAGKKGVSISLCSSNERKLISNIEHYINIRISVFRGHKYHSYEIEKMNLKGTVKEKNQRSASSLGKRKHTEKDRRSALKKRTGIEHSGASQNSEKRVSLSEAKKVRKKSKKETRKNELLLNRLRKYYKP